MERTISIEEKIRRAEEIYERRKEGNIKKTAAINVNNKLEKKKDIKLLKKMTIQILISVFIYLAVYTIQNSNYIFSDDFINKTNEILSYDTNFLQIYENLKDKIINLKNEQSKNILEEENEKNTENNIENIENDKNIESNIQIEENTNISDSEEIQKIKETTTFIKPLEGEITSKFGQREPTTSTVPKNHTGIDIGAKTGTKIISSTEGEVVLASEEGDYGKHLKIQIGEVSIIYAHCNSLYVKQGEYVKQGQEIAEVGSTGNSTGPHLHFEIRISEKTIDPEKILQF